MASDSAVRDFMDLRFVDHYERKIQTPDKEKISPTKEVIKPVSEINEELSYIDEKSSETIDSNLVSNMVEKESDSSSEDEVVREKKSVESDSDSGLDSSDNVSAENEINEKFIDRKEDIIYAEIPDVLQPPSTTLEPVQSTSRIVDELFNFIDEEGVGAGLEEEDENVEEKEIDKINNYTSERVDWSLDAVNNNSEEVIKSAAIELRNEPSTDTEFVLTAKTETPPKIVEDNVHLVPDTTSDSSMNLYWYSTNLELDPNEIQEFKNSQEENDDPRSRSATGYEYYRDKMEDSSLPREERMLQTEHIKLNLEAGTVDSERWSPLYESASSRCLDVASEMKTQPNAKRSKEITGSDGKTLEHPWGLEIENKLHIESDSKQEELPLIEPKFHPVADTSLESQQNGQPEDSTDMKVNFQVRRNLNLKQFNADFVNGTPKIVSEMKEDIQNEKQNATDQADAIDYMDLNDRESIKAQEVVVEEAAPDQDMNADAVEIKSNISHDAETIKDQPDATRLMELVDRDRIEEQIDNALYAVMSEMKVDIQNEKQNATDQADAIGYRDSNDRESVKVQEVMVEEAAPIQDVNVDTVEIKANLSHDAVTVIDQPDATGLMELVDRNRIKEQIDNALYAELSEKDVKNVDNLRKKSEDNVTERFEKGDTEDLQTEGYDMRNKELTEPDTESGMIDLKRLETNILSYGSNIKEGKHDSEDTVDSALQELKKDLDQDVEAQIQETESQEQEIKLEVSHNVEAEVQKNDLQALQTERAEAVVLKHEPVELSRKFKVSDDSENIIYNKGGKLVKSETFVDEYFDDSGYSLTLRDSWFRKRNEKFELKTNCSAILSGGRIVQDEMIIMQSLKRILSWTSQVEFTKNLSELICDLGLTEFATFQTSRHHYELNDYTLTLDLTDFGYHSGDIKITVDNPSKVPDAIQRIERLAKDLGFQLLQAH